MSRRTLHRADLKPYQLQAIDFAKRTENCALWLPMGYGKCVSTLTAYADLLESFDARRALVIGPLRVARRVWSDEAQVWSHLAGIHVARMVGSRAERLAALRTPADIHTINRENLPWLEAQFIQNGKQTTRWPWDLVVVDESSGFKSQSSKRWKSLRRLRRLFPRMIQLTGTPAPNGLQDIWAQLYLLDRGARLGATESAFLDRWFTPPAFGEFGKWTIKNGAREEIEERIQDIVFSPERELDGPPVETNQIRVTLPEPILKKYRQLERQFILETLSGKTVTAVNAGVCAGKLLQLANGAIYTGEGREWEELHSEKLDALEELLEGIRPPVLIVYSYRHDLARILPRIQLYGSAAVLKHDRDFDAFRERRIDYGVLHPASAGHGLNDLHLSGAETLIHFGLTNNLEHYQQVNARLTGGHRRSGKNVVIHLIVADGTIDEDMVELLDDKSADQNSLTRALAARIRA